MGGGAGGGGDCGEREEEGRAGRRGGEEEGRERRGVVFETKPSAPEGKVKVIKRTVLYVVNRNVG